jgi:hypothetical protein
VGVRVPRRFKLQHHLHHLHHRGKKVTLNINIIIMATSSSTSSYPIEIPEWNELDDAAAVQGMIWMIVVFRFVFLSSCGRRRGKFLVLSLF